MVYCEEIEKEEISSFSSLNPFNVYLKGFYSVNIANNVPLDTVDFVYDANGTRTKKVVGANTTLYIGEHYEIRNGVVTKYIFGGSLRLAVIKGTVVNYYHKDHLGSTAAVTDSSGVTVEASDYQPFGTFREHTGDTGAYEFTDQELDNETNLYNYDARLYDPVLGRFVTPDSVIQNQYDPQTLNHYAYCRNNPLIYTDPTGHVWDYYWFSEGRNYNFSRGNNFSYTSSSWNSLTSFFSNTWKSYQHQRNMYSILNGPNRGDNQLNRNYFSGSDLEVNYFQKDPLPIWNQQKSTDYLNDPKNGWNGTEWKHYCAKAIRGALNAGGIKTSPTPDNNLGSAYQYGTYLPTIGFRSVSQEGYTPNTWDIAVFPALDDKHKWGHIQAYVADRWRSDCLQPLTGSDINYGKGFYANFIWKKHPFIIFRYGGPVQ